MFASTVKPVIRGHLWDKKGALLSYKTGDLLIGVHFI
jgi:hypothetical protein